MYRLERVDDLGRELSIVLPSNKVEYTLGREDDNDIVLAATSVSRHHAVIHLTDEKLLIDDLGSVNGVLVNNRKIEGPTPLLTGDEIIIGEDRLFVRESQDEPVAVKSTMVMAPGEIGMLVLAKFLDGRKLRGTSHDLALKPYFHLHTADGQNQKIEFSHLKAVFLLRNASHVSTFRAPRYGRKMLIRFLDGEVLIGTVLDTRDRQDRLTLFPIHDLDSNERVICNTAAIAFTRQLGIATQGAEKGPLPLPTKSDLTTEDLDELVSGAIHDVAAKLHSRGQDADSAFTQSAARELSTRLRLVRERYENAFGGPVEWKKCVGRILKETVVVWGESMKTPMRNILTNIVQ